MASLSEITKNIFVSHHHLDADKIERFRDLIGRHGVETRDSSIYEAKLKNDAKNENYIKYELITPQIRWASTVFVLIGKDTAKSDYVNWEIETAAKMGKQIIGVYLQGAKDEDVPPALLEYGDNLVGWNGERIRRALEGEDLDWENADGTPRENQDADFPRYQC